MVKKLENEEMEKKPYALISVDIRLLDGVDVITMSDSMKDNDFIQDDIF